MQFQGFNAHDFELFSIPDFEGRMAEIRASVKPKLQALGHDLTERIEERVPGPVFPHVAQHMRRRVNPPAETWVAFCRDKKGYKRWTHYRVAISGQGIRVVVFIEDDADDKAPFGATLAEQATKILSDLGGDVPVLWYTLNEARPVPTTELSAEMLVKVGDDLQRLKTRKFITGVPLPVDQALKLSPSEFEDWALQQVDVLKPLYVAGSGQG